MDTNNNEYVAGENDSNSNNDQQRKNNAVIAGVIAAPTAKLSGMLDLIRDVLAEDATAKVELQYVWLLDADAATLKHCGKLIEERIATEDPGFIDRMCSWALGNWKYLLGGAVVAGVGYAAYRHYSADDTAALPCSDTDIPQLGIVSDADRMAS